MKTTDHEPDVPPGPPFIPFRPRRKRVQSLALFGGTVRS
jgi:hypothetical protein